MGKLVTKEILFLALILIFGFFVRLYKIGSPLADWHSWRQADTASVSRIYVEEGIDLLAPRYYDISRIQTGAMNYQGLRLVEFPIFNVIHAFLAKNITSCPNIQIPAGRGRLIFNFLFPANIDLNLVGVPCFEIWGRLVSIFSSTVSAVFLYLIGKKLYGKWVGVLAAFLFEFLPYNIYFSRVILPEPMAVTLALVSLWLFMSYLEKEKFWFLSASGVFFAASTLVKPFTFFYALPMIYLAYKKYGSVRKLIFEKKLLVFANLAIAPFFLWRIWINQFPIGIPHFTWAFNGDGIRFRPAFWYWLFGERIGKLILGVWGVVPLAWGLTRVRKNLFAHFWVLSMVFYVTLVATANVRHDYYQIYLVPPLALMVAIGVARARGLAEKLLVAVSVVLMILVGGFQVKEFYRINHPEIVVAGKAAQKLIPREARIIAPYNGDTAFLYQTARFGWPVVDESFDKMIKKGARYFVAVNFADPDVAYVEKNFKVLAKADQYLIAELTERIK